MKPVSDKTVVLDIESIDLDANGVARHEGKVMFVRGALPREKVVARVVRSKPRFEVCETVEVLRASSSRVTPRCPHFGVCGGCSMQHVDGPTQLAIKQRVLEDQLQHLSKLKPQMVLRPIAGPGWGYRFRARLSVRDVVKKGGVLVGFHERGSSFVADMRECHVLPTRVASLLVPLRGLVASLAMRKRMPQIEVALGSDDVLALVFRVLEPADDGDRALLEAFALEHRLELWLQPKGPDTIVLLCDGIQPVSQGTPVSRLGYRLDEFGITMPYRPTDFTQVNHAVNEMLVGRAVRLLDPQPTDRVADLFCGLGNFTLPIARRAGTVVGIEGAASLVRRAQDNAAVNGLAGSTSFQVANLFDMTLPRWQALGAFDRLLIDPPREGALELSRAIAADTATIQRIVYVSCNPATLARDAGMLVHEGGYRLMAAGAINMFPQTSHVESIAVFEPGDRVAHRAQRLADAQAAALAAAAAAQALAAEQAVAEQAAAASPSAGPQG